MLRANTNSVSDNPVTRPGSAMQNSNLDSVRQQPPFQEPNKKPKCNICKFIKYSILFFILLIFFELIYENINIIIAYTIKVLEENKNICLNLVNTIFNIISLLVIALICFFSNSTSLFSTILDIFIKSSYLYNSNEDDEGTTINTTFDIQDLSNDTKIPNIAFTESKDQSNNNNETCVAETADGNKNNSKIETDNNSAMVVSNNTSNEGMGNEASDNTQNKEEFQSSNTHVTSNTQATATPTSGLSGQCPDNEEYEDEIDKYLYSKTTSPQTPSTGSVGFVEQENNNQISTEQQPQATQDQNALTITNSTAIDTSFIANNNEDSKDTQFSLSSDHADNMQEGENNDNIDTNTSTRLIGTEGTDLPPFINNDPESIKTYIAYYKHERACREWEASRAAYVNINQDANRTANEIDNTLETLYSIPRKY